MSTESNPTGTTGSTAGAKIKGVFGAIHGAGEAIRGTINETLDKTGEAIANKPDGTIAQSRTENPGSVVERGKAELKSSMERLEK